MLWMKKLTRAETEKEIEDFFKNIDSKTPKEIKKIKRLSMKHNIKLGNLRKKFCKKCYSTFPINAKIRIKKNMKIVKCKKCSYVSRWRFKDKDRKIKIS